MYIYTPMGKIQISTLTNGFGYQDCKVVDVFQNLTSKLVQDIKYVKTYLYDLLIITISSFKDHLF
jgi:hypothetical protein